MRLSQWLIVFLFTISLAGCGGTSKHEALMEEMITNMNQLSEDMNSGDMNKAKATAEKMKGYKARIDALPKVTKAQDDALKAKYEPRIKEATQKMMTGMMAATAKNPAEAAKLAEVLKSVR